MFQKTPSMLWEIATVTGAVLPFEGRKLWLKKNKNLKKGSEYYREFFKTKREGAVCRLLDDMIECRVKGVLFAGDIGHVSEQDAEKFRRDWVLPHYAFADSEPAGRRESLRHHLDNLMGNKKPVLSLQDFFKVLGILEVISSFFVIHFKNLRNHGAVDLQKIKLIIDDQSKASLTSLKDFSNYYIFCRAQDGLYRAPPGSIHLLGKLARKIEDQTVFDASKILSKTLVEEKANMDDKYPELKIADLLSNFTWHALNGHFSMKVVQKLDKIFSVVHSVCFDPKKEVTANIPPSAQEAVNLLFRKDRK